MSPEREVRWLILIPGRVHGLIRGFAGWAEFSLPPATIWEQPDLDVEYQMVGETHKRRSLTRRGMQRRLMRLKSAVPKPTP